MTCENKHTLEVSHNHMYPKILATQINTDACVQDRCKLPRVNRYTQLCVCTFTYPLCAQAHITH